MPKYVVHVGPPKTGSTYLQACLADLRDRLREDGIWYPDLWLEGKVRNSHSQLAVLLAAPEPPDLREEFRRINAEGHRIVVLSCEVFFGLPADRLALLKELMGTSEVELVYYCRRWSDRLPSIWNQNVRAGQAETIPEFLNHYFRGPVRAMNVNYGLIWERIAGVFGREAVRIVPYSTLMDAGADLFEHFSREFLGWSGAKAPDQGKRLNESHGLAEMEMLRALNALHLRRTGKQGGAVGGRFLERRAALDTGLIEAAIRAHTASVTLRDNSDTFAEVLAALAKWEDRIADAAHGRRMFRPKRREIEYARPDYLLEDGVAVALQDIYRQLTGGAGRGKAAA